MQSIVELDKPRTRNAAKLLSSFRPLRPFALRSRLLPKNSMCALARATVAATERSFVRTGNITATGPSSSAETMIDDGGITTVTTIERLSSSARAANTLPESLETASLVGQQIVRRLLVLLQASAFQKLWSAIFRARSPARML